MPIDSNSAKKHNMTSQHKPNPEIAAMATAVGLYMYVKDHTGARFLGIAEMAEAWGIDVHIFVHRQKALGWTTERALTTPERTN